MSRGEIPILDRETAQEIATEASVLMKQGLALRAEPNPAALHKAIECFERALELRRRLPVRTFPVLQYDLAACWLNLAETRAEVGTTEEMNRAVGEYDHGIDLLRRLPLHEDPRFPRRLAIAYQNRALTIQVLNPAPTEQISTDFRSAIETLERVADADCSDRDYVLAAIWLNFANVQLRDGRHEAVASAQSAIARARALVSKHEATEPSCASVGVMARHALCRAIARLLADIDGTGSTRDELYDATDVVDEALSLIGSWEQRGMTAFRAQASELFRFGAHLYAKYQPQFLQEYIAETLDPARSSVDFVESVEMRNAADDIIAATQAEPVSVRLTWPAEFFARPSGRN